MKLYEDYWGLDARKTIFRVYDQIIHNPTSSATEATKKNDISLVASIDMILSNKRITEPLIRLPGRAGWFAP